MDERGEQRCPEGEATGGGWPAAFAVTALSPVAAAIAALLLTAFAGGDVAWAVYLACWTAAGIFSGFGPTLVRGPLLPRTVAAVVCAVGGAAAYFVLFAIGSLVRIQFEL